MENIKVRSLTDHKLKVIRGPLTRHLELMRFQHQHDLERSLGGVVFPNALDRKYPNAGREWAWQWVFPASKYYVGRATGERYKHHLHESVVQKAVKEAVRNAEIPKSDSSTHLGIPLLPTYWKTATTSGRSQTFWGTRMSVQR